MHSIELIRRTRRMMSSAAIISNICAENTKTNANAAFKITGVTSVVTIAKI